MRTVFSQLRAALRQWRRHPAVGLVIVLSVAAGIAANATVFAWIDGVLLRPLPGTPAGLPLYALENVAPNGEGVPSSWPDFLDLRNHARTPAGIAATLLRRFQLGGRDAAGRGAADDRGSEPTWANSCRATSSRCSACGRAWAASSTLPSAATGPAPRRWR